MSKKPRKRKPGPKEERLKIDGDWRDAAKKAARKPKPRPTQQGG